MVRLNARVEIDSPRRFSDGLLLDIVRALRAIEDGERFAIKAPSDVRDELSTWSQLTGNPIVGVTDEEGGTRFVIRRGAARGITDDARPVPSRVWLYTNFDCNLACSYCCVRSSPRALRRALGQDVVEKLVAELSREQVSEVFITGGEPFLVPDIAAIAKSCAALAPTTILTNGMLFEGKRRTALEALARDRVTLQISIDSPTPSLHDLHRGKGSFDRAMRGVTLARSLGFRVRLAATVATEHDEQSFRAYLDEQGIPAEDRVIRRVALRGFADDGVALTRAELHPELTITSSGIYWHPVGADDADMLVTRELFPIREAIEKMREMRLVDVAYHAAVGSVFHCA